MLPGLLPVLGRHGGLQPLTMLEQAEKRALLVGVDKRRLLEQEAEAGLEPRSEVGIAKPIDADAAESRQGRH